MKPFCLRLDTMYMQWTQKLSILPIDVCNLTVISSALSRALVHIINFLHRLGLIIGYITVTYP